jgi:hypothetical protein
VCSSGFIIGFVRVIMMELSMAVEMGVLGLDLLLFLIVSDIKGLSNLDLCDSLLSF